MDCIQIWQAWTLTEGVCKLIDIKNYTLGHSIDIVVDTDAMKSIIEIQLLNCNNTNPIIVQKFDNR